MRPASSLILIMALGLAACGGNKGLRDLSDPAAGPEEFAIVPNKPLQSPENYSALPTPTPGAANLGDATPRQDAIAALGGNPARAVEQNVPASDGALIASASRYGVPANIRGTTAEEDAAFRKRRGRFTNIRLFKTDSYAQVYKKQTLDAEATLNAARRAGLKTPTAPAAE